MASLKSIFHVAPFLNVWIRQLWRLVMKSYSLYRRFPKRSEIAYTRYIQIEKQIGYTRSLFTSIVQLQRPDFYFRIVPETINFEPTTFLTCKKWRKSIKNCRRNRSILQTATNTHAYTQTEQEALLWQRDRARHLSVEILTLQNISLENPIVWHYLRDSTFSRIDIISECDRHTHRHTDRHTTTAYTALSIASRGKRQPYFTAHQL